MVILALILLGLTQATAQPGPVAGTQAPRDARPAPAGTGVIRGRVVADDTGEPIRACRVMLMTGALPYGPQRDPHPRMTETLFARTTEDGRYEFTQLAAGTYRVSAMPEMSSPRYVPPALGRSATPFGKPMELVDGQKLEAPEIRLPRGGVLSGRVVDEFGEPVAYVRVNALMRIGGGEPRQGGMSMNGTDDLGRFRLFGLAPGDYYLVAEPQFFGLPTAGEVTRPLSTYFPSSPTVADATPIRLAAGQEIGDLEIRLVIGRTFTISGTVVTSQGQPITRQTGNVMFLQKSTSGGMSGSSVDHRDDGTFAIRGVKPGTYELEVRRHDALPHGAEYAAAPITVVDTDVENLIIATRAGATVAGEVVFDPADTDRSESIEVTAPPATRLMMGPPSQARVAPDGTFQLVGLFRPVYIRVSTPKGYDLESVTLEGQDITNTAIDFKPGAKSKVVVTLTQRSSELSGQVTTVEGRPAAGLVFAFGEDRALWNPHATTTKYVPAGEKGNYRITGLRPGRYLVVAVPPGSGPPMMFGERVEAWEALAKKATPVTVGDQERKTLDLVSELDR